MPAERFAADAMLGRLARWLRILGYDTAYGPHLRRHVLVSCARQQGRMLLTRDTRLLRDPNLPPHIFIRSDHFRDQLREVVTAAGLGTAGLGSRCLGCNRCLEPVAKEAVAARLPAYVAATQERFLICKGCAHLYWPATHRSHMVAELRRLGLHVGSDS